MSKDLVRNYLAENQILIADAVSSARVTLASNLIKLGASRSRMSLVSSFEEAQEVIKHFKPKIILCDFMLGKKSGLDLLQEQKQIYDSTKIKDTLFVLVTSKGSQSAVARAAEEDVDTFILKPYTMRRLQKSFNQAVLAKLLPDEYHRKIALGKDLLFAGKIEPALVTFKEALGLDQNPTLACFYIAQAEEMKKSIAAADGSYRQGLSYVSIHYKCLVGLYDLLMRQEKFTEAYDLVKRIAGTFPANPKRLAAVLRLAITTANYSDIPAYYDLFLALDERPEELTRHICSAMAVAGKHALKRGQNAKAVDIFDKLAVTCAGRTNYLRYMVEAFVSQGMYQDASRCLKRFSPESQLKEDYKISEFLVVSGTRPASEAISLGQQLLRDGVESQELYHVLIRLAQSQELPSLSEDLSRKLAHFASNGVS